jgi:hypothetical protein
MRQKIVAEQTRAGSTSDQTSTAATDRGIIEDFANTEEEHPTLKNAEITANNSAAAPKVMCERPTPQPFANQRKLFVPIEPLSDHPRHDVFHE